MAALFKIISTCGMCTQVKEVRPYGSPLQHGDAAGRNSWVCLKCAMKDSKGTQERIRSQIISDAIEIGRLGGCATIPN